MWMHSWCSNWRIDRSVTQWHSNLHGEKVGCRFAILFQRFVLMRLLFCNFSRLDRVRRPILVSRTSRVLPAKSKSPERVSSLQVLQPTHHHPLRVRSGSSTTCRSHRMVTFTVHRRINRGRTAVAGVVMTDSGVVSRADCFEMLTMAKKISDWDCDLLKF
jgi:hypothetical protein